MTDSVQEKGSKAPESGQFHTSEQSERIQPVAAAGKGTVIPENTIGNTGDRHRHASPCPEKLQGFILIAGAAFEL